MVKKTHLLFIRELRRMYILRLFRVAFNQDYGVLSFLSEKVGGKWSIFYYYVHRLFTIDDNIFY